MWGKSKYIKDISRMENLSAGRRGKLAPVADAGRVAAALLAVLVSDDGNDMTARRPGGDVDAYGRIG